MNVQLLRRGSNLHRQCICRLLLKYLHHPHIQQSTSTLRISVFCSVEMSRGACVTDVMKTFVVLLARLRASVGQRTISNGPREFEIFLTFCIYVRRFKSQRVSFRSFSLYVPHANTHRGLRITLSHKCYEPAIRRERNMLYEYVTSHSLICIIYTILTFYEC